MLGTPSEQFKLVFNSKELSLWHSLEDFGIKKDSEIFLELMINFIVLKTLSPQK